MSASSERPRPRADGPAISVGPLRYHMGDVVADKYRLEALLGQGGMGSVWRAKNLALDADVAVKLVHGHMASDETTERLEFEAHAAAQLDHPSAVRIFDLGQTELGDPFIVMELLRGESLRDLLEKRLTLPASEIVPLLLPVASALSAAHDKGIVHRDLKPDNVVLVEHDGALLPKVVDFGIAKIERSRFDKHTTTEGTVLGSPAYMSPEHARGEVELIGAQSDVWSLGVVLYESLAGRPPFEGKNQLATLRAIVETEPVSLASLGVADARLSTIVARALAKDVTARWSDMRAFGRALAEWALAQGIDTDASGQSIAVHWLRPHRGSQPSDAAVATSSDARTKPLEELPRPSVAVWHAPGRAKISRSRWAIVAAAGVAVALALALTLLPRAGGLGRVAPSNPASTAITPAKADEDSPATSAPASAPLAASGASVSAPSSSPAASSVAAGPAPVVSPADTRACIEQLFPGDAFESDAPLERLCGEDNPRRGAALLRSELARHGFVVKRTTESMRIWALLSWYELATFAVARGACCSADHLEALDIPPSVGTCPSLSAPLDRLGRKESSEAIDASVASFREAVLCLERGQRLNAGVASPYDYVGPPDGGAESAFRRILDRARTRPSVRESR